MNPHPHFSRREWLQNTSAGFGYLALSALATQRALADNAAPLAPKQPHFPAKAKRVLFLCMDGGPSHVDSFDYKPELAKYAGKAIGKGKVPTGKLMAPVWEFKQRGQSGLWISELFPQIATHADKLCLIRSMKTDVPNHPPAFLQMHCGIPTAPRPSMGAWINYGLGSENSNLPGFVVLISKGKGGQPLGAHLWGSGFLSADQQGIQFRPSKDPVLYLNNPEGISGESRRLMLDRLAELHAHQMTKTPDPGIQARISNYEMAFRMQSSIPAATDFSKETESTLNLYGPESRSPGSFAANCLQARRLAESGVRFIQLYHQDWDHHGGLPSALPKLCKETDQACAGLLIDLQQRGMLDDTLVVWGGEFGRTNYCQGKLSANFGRDHHPRCFTTWMAGGGIKGGTVYGETDEFGYNIAGDGVHVHDFQATILHLLGIDHEALTYKFQGRRYRLTDVHGKVVKGLLA